MSLPSLVFHDDPLPAGWRDPASELGSKGMSMRWLHERAIRVPYGFTIRADVCRHFLAHSCWPDDVWWEVVHAVHRIKRHIESRDGVSGADLLQLAVRSGAAVSMPGLLHTHLNVAAGAQSGMEDRSSDDDSPQLRRAIEDVFRSWNSASARHYRETCSIDESLATAVTVQEMIPCIASGVLFTQSPESMDQNMVVEAVPGTGAALVAGEVTPRRWVIDRDCGRIVEGPCATVEMVGVVDRLPELHRSGLQLEEKVGQPLDIEWGLDGQGLVFFQVRPIVGGIPVTMTSRRHPRKSSGSASNADEVTSDQQRANYIERERLRLRQLADAGARCWVRHNLSETLSCPTPLTWSLWQSFMSGSGGLGTLYRRLGYRPGGRAMEGFLVLIGGRIYADPDRATEMFGKSWPLSYDLDELRRDSTLLDLAPRRFDPQRLDPFFLWRLPSLGLRMWQVQRRFVRQLETAAHRFEAEVVPEFHARIERERATDLTRFSTDRLIQLFADRKRWIMDEFGPESLLPALLGGMAHAELTRQVGRILGPQSAGCLLDEFLPAGDVELIGRQQSLLAGVSHIAGREAFLSEFGHRAVGEMDLAVPRWRESPDCLEKLAAGSVYHQNRASSLDHLESRERLRRSFADAGAASLFDSAAAWFDHCWRLLPYRDRGKHLFLMGYELLRDVAEVLGRRLDLGDDVYFLQACEWSDVISGTDMRPTIDQRRFDAEIAHSLHLPAFIAADRIEETFASRRVRPLASCQQGIPLVGGHGGGVVRSPAALSGQTASDVDTVLVCEAVKPSMAPVLMRMSAVVVERGGGLSHSAILARQFGIPMVRLDDATRRLLEGQRVHVDGRTGQIEIVSEVPV